MVALLTAALFIFQLSRSFLILPLNGIICPEYLNGSMQYAVHNHHHEDSAAGSQDESSGNTLQHCKDYALGFLLTPVQPLRLSAVVMMQPPESSRMLVLPGLAPVFQSDLRPPFQPPRA